MTMGQRAMRWSDVAAYVRTLRGLLRGEQALWEGKPIQMHIRLASPHHDRWRCRSSSPRTASKALPSRARTVLAVAIDELRRARLFLRERLGAYDVAIVVTRTGGGPKPARRIPPATPCGFGPRGSGPADADAGVRGAARRYAGLL